MPRPAAARSDAGRDPAGERPPALARLSNPANQTDRAFAEISKAIQSGQLAPGSLHSAQTLAEQLGVSRTPVREALLRLAETGAVYFERYRGVRIAETSANDLREVYELRRWLEVPAARLIAVRRTEADLKVLSDRLWVPNETEWRTSGQDSPVVPMPTFHVTLTAMTGNTKLPTIIESLRTAVLTHSANPVHRAEMRAHVIEEHNRIIEAIRQGNADEAGQAMDDHLRSFERILTGPDSAS
jgi:DNA-binding GntR family transcriptional regulator